MGDVLKLHTLILLTGTLCFTAFAQPPDSLWSRTYEGSGWDECRSVVQTAGDGYLLAGYTLGPEELQEQFWLVRTDDQGDSLWSRTFGGSGMDMCSSVLQTSDGGCLLAGWSSTYGAGEQDFLLIRTDENGGELRVRSYGGASQERCYALQRTWQGEYLLAGYTASFGSGMSDFWLVCVNENGDSLWSRTYGGSSNEECQAVMQTSDGGFALAGHTWSPGTEDWDFLLVRTDENGDSLWSRTYGGSGYDQCFAAQETAGGGFVLAGYTESFGAGGEDVWLVKTDADGDSVWSLTLGGASDERCYSLLQTPDRGFVLAGWTESFGLYRADLWLVKVSENGDSLWSRTFSGRCWDDCMAVRQTSDGGFILAGSTGYPPGEWRAADFFLVKTGPDLTPAVEPSVLVPKQYSLTAYPNPFNPTTTISFDLPKAMQAQLRIFDITGRTVTTLADEQFTAGAHQLRFDGSRLPSGVYFARLQTGSFSEARKLILLK